MNLVVVSHQFDIMVTLKLALAMLCFQGHCYPALVGVTTPKGIFHLQLVTSKQPGYGGDVIKFNETPTSVFAIHRLWTLNPKQHREQRIRSVHVHDRVITDGCVNVLPAVYEQLKDCCSSDTLLIE